LVAVHPFEVLAEPVRRRILELLAGAEMSSGDVVAVIQPEFGISQPGVSQHLKVLYSIERTALEPVEAWLGRLRPAPVAWTPHLDALATELARGRRASRHRTSPTEEMRDIS
jgi:DNA-binding transcriptional ArsR family regulator